MTDLIEYYKINNVINIPIKIESKLNFIKELLNYNFSLDSNYKFEKYYELFEFIISFIINNNELNTDEVNEIIFSSNFITYITSLSKGQKLLKKFKSRLKKIIVQETIIDFLIISASYGTFYTFLFWLNFLNYKSINELEDNHQKIIIQSSINNPDDRLYTYILKNNEILISNKKLIDDIIISICNIKKKKYILQKIKILNQYIILDPFINNLIYNIKDYNIILQLHKHYTIKYNFII